MTRNYSNVQIVLHLFHLPYIGGQQTANLSHLLFCFSLSVWWAEVKPTVLWSFAGGLVWTVGWIQCKSADAATSAFFHHVCMKTWRPCSGSEAHQWRWFCTQHTQTSYSKCGVPILGSAGERRQPLLISLFFTSYRTCEIPVNIKAL